MISLSKQIIMIRLAELFLIIILALCIAGIVTMINQNVNNKKVEIYFNNPNSLNITSNIFHCIILGDYQIKKPLTNEFIFTDGKNFYHVSLTEKEYKILFDLIKRSKEIK